MEELAILLVAALVLAPIILSIMALARVNESLRANNANRQQTNNELNKLRAEVDFLRVLAYKLRSGLSAPESIVWPDPNETNASQAATSGTQDTPPADLSNSQVRPESNSAGGVSTAPSPLAATPTTATKAAGLDELPKRSSIEDAIGERWLAWIGGLVALIAVAFALKYASDQGWVTPMTRCISAAVLGLALVPFGMRLSATRYRILGQALSATGLVVLMVDTMAAHSMFGLITSPRVAMALVLIPIAGSWWLSGRFHSIGFHSLGLLAGITIPTLVRLEGDTPGWILGYGVLITGVALALALHRGLLISIPLTAVAAVCHFAVNADHAASHGLLTPSAAAIGMFMVALAVIGRRNATNDKGHPFHIEMPHLAAFIAAVGFPCVGSLTSTGSPMAISIVIGYVAMAAMALPNFPTIARVVTGCAVALSLHSFLGKSSPSAELDSTILHLTRGALVAGTLFAAFADVHNRCRLNATQARRPSRDVGSASLLIPVLAAFLHVVDLGDSYVYAISASALLVAVAARFSAVGFILPAFTAVLAIVFIRCIDAAMRNAITPTALLTASVTSAVALTWSVHFATKNREAPKLAWISSALAFLALSPAMGCALRLLSPSLPSWAIPFVVDIPGLALLVVTAAKIPKAQDSSRSMARILAMSTVVVVFLLLNAEIVLAFRPWIPMPVFGLVGSGNPFSSSANLDPSFAEEVCRSIAWALFSLVLIFVGFKKNLAMARKAGLLLLAATFAKCFFIDVWELDGLFRVGALAGLSVALFLGAFLYQRFVRPLAD